MNKENKYYNLIEDLVKQNKKFIGNEMYFDDIVNDVLVHANTIIQTIDNKQVIEDFLTKAVSNSIITVTKKMNKDSRSSNAKELIERINNKNQNENINKKYIDNFINGNDNNIKSLKENTEQDNETITYEDLAEISIDSEQIAEHNEDSIIEEVQQDDIENENDTDFYEQATLLNESLELFGSQEISNINDTDITDENIDIVAPTTNSEPSDSTDEEHNNQDDTNIDMAHELDTLDLTLDETEDINASEFEETNLDNNSNNTENIYDISNDYEEQEVLDIDSNNPADLNLNEIDTDEKFEINDYSVDTSDNAMLNEDLTEVSASSNIYTSVLELLKYEQMPKNSDYAEIDTNKIIEEINATDAEYPELNIMNVYKLRYIEGMDINNISETLGLEETEVVKALNLISNIV